MKPLVSVIVPLFNKEEWVARCIISIIGQSYQNIEILIVNDGSTDNSLKVVSAIKDHRIEVFNKSNGGVSSARNFGLERAKGEFIALIDADDEWKQYHLELLLKGFKEKDTVVLVCCAYVEATEEGKITNNPFRNYFGSEKTDQNKSRFFHIDDYLGTLSGGHFLLSGSSVLMKSSVIKTNQLRFSESLALGEDINYWLRVNQYGKFVACNYVGMVYHKADEKSAMNSYSNETQFTPDYFKGINIDIYDRMAQCKVKKFLLKEYDKKAYQNRKLKFQLKELDTRIGSGIQIGRMYALRYIVIRYLPEFVFLFYKKKFWSKYVFYVSSY